MYIYIPALYTHTHTCMSSPANSRARKHNYTHTNTCMYPPARNNQCSYNQCSPCAKCGYDPMLTCKISLGLV